MRRESQILSSRQRDHSSRNHCNACRTDYYAAMTRLPALICLVLAALVLRASAEGPDDQYLRIYELIQQGDSLAFSGQSSQSMAKYVEAQTALQKFQKGYPDWNDQIVKFRLNYLEGKISALASQLPAAAGPQSGPP